MRTDITPLRAHLIHSVYSNGSQRVGRGPQQVLGDIQGALRIHTASH
jgi:hypothetical protein